jgi:outer membrane protein
MRFFWCCCLFLFFLPDSKAQNSGWTLQQCIDHAIKNNLSVRQTQLNQNLAEQNLLQSKAGTLPSLNGSASNVYNFGQTIDPFTNTFATARVRSDRFSISSNLTLFSGLQQYNTIQANTLSLFASKQDLEKIKNDVSLNIATAFIQILFNRELLMNSRNQAQVTRLQVERTRKLVDAGGVARNVLLDLDAQLANEDLAVVNAENQFSLANLNLALLLDLKELADFSISVPDVAEPSASLLAQDAETIFRSAETGQPGMKAAEARVNSAAKSVLVAKGARYPTLSIFGSFGTGYSGAAREIVGTSNTTIPIGFTQNGETVFTTARNFDYQLTPWSKQLDNNLNKTFGLTLQVPFFNGLQTYTGIERAKINFESARLNLETTRRDLRRTIHQAHADALNAWKKLEATRKSVEALTLSFENTEKRFNVGMLNSVEYNDAKNKLNQSKSTLLQAKYDYLFKVKVLDFYQGKPLTL